MGNSTGGRTRNRREEFEKRRAKTKAKHAAQSVWNTVMLLTGLAMLLGTGGGLVYYFAFYEKPEINMSEYEKSFRVLEKEMLTGEIIAKELENGEASKDFADWVDPRFFIICEADFTKSRVVFQIPESTYNNVRKGDIFTREQVTRWTVIDRSIPNLIEVIEQTSGVNLNALKQ